MRESRKRITNELTVWYVDQYFVHNTVFLQHNLLCGLQYNQKLNQI